MSGEPSTMGNNRIRDTRCLNQYSRQEAVLERFFFALGPKILFQQHRPIATRRLRMAERRFRRKAEMALSSLPCAASRRRGGGEGARPARGQLVGAPHRLRFPARPNARIITTKFTDMAIPACMAPHALPNNIRRN